jgi:hypothetical protein
LENRNRQDEIIESSPEFLKGRWAESSVFLWLHVLRFSRSGSVQGESDDNVGRGEEDEHLLRGFGVNVIEGDLQVIVAHSFEFES